MPRIRYENLILDCYGSFVGMEKGCYIVKDRHGEVKRYPQFEVAVREVILKSGNLVSTGALTSFACWEIPVLILTRRGRPVAFLKSFTDDSHVKTRVCQYEAFKNGKGVHVAKQVVIGKVESQNKILIKHGLRQHDLMSVKRTIDNIETDSLKAVRKRLLPIEGKCSQQYLNRVFQLFPKAIRVKKRKTFKAYDGLNNVFNLGYAVLKWKIHIALVKAKLEPFLGFLHSETYSMPSLVCDFMELYRCLVDDFLIGFCKNLKVKDFVVKHEDFSSKRKGKRVYLKSSLEWELINGVYKYFMSKVDIARIRHGKRQTLDTLICEEALLFAMYLRGKRKSWYPRIAIP